MHREADHRDAHLRAADHHHPAATTQRRHQVVEHPIQVRASGLHGDGEALPPAAARGLVQRREVLDAGDHPGQQPELMDARSRDAPARWRSVSATSRRKCRSRRVTENQRADRRAAPADGIDRDHVGIDLVMSISRYGAAAEWSTTTSPPTSCTSLVTARRSVTVPSVDDADAIATSRVALLIRLSHCHAGSSPVSMSTSAHLTLGADSGLLPAATGRCLPRRRAG